MSKENNPSMYDYHCGKCGGLVAEPMKAYGYSGQYCHCEIPTPTDVQEPSEEPISLTHRAIIQHETRTQVLNEVIEIVKKCTNQDGDIEYIEVVPLLEALKK